MERFWKKVQKSDQCWEWLAAKNENGYGVFRTRNMIASRVAWVLSHGEISEGLSVLHKCDNPGCVNPEKENAHDRESRNRGNHAKGERVAKTKLTPDQVLAIRDDPRPSREVAKDYGVNHTCICSARRGRTWSHI